MLSVSSAWVFSIMEVAMVEVLIRDLDENVIDAMKSKAKLYGRSLESQLRAVIEAAVPFTPEERVEASRRLREGQQEVKDFDVRAAIRFGRDDEFDE
jgi:plasmid stability protein